MNTDTPETDAMASMRRTTQEWQNHSEPLERERDALQAQLREEMKLHVQTLNERDVWKYNAGIVDEERKAENQKAIDLFIELHELRFAVKTLRDAPSHQLREQAADHLFSLLP